VIWPPPKGRDSDDSPPLRDVRGVETWAILGRQEPGILLA
jgi:hypothetical protein